MCEAESRNSTFATVGASSEDWVNPIECVPGQPYCGQTALSSAEAQLQGSVTQEDAEKEPSAAETKQQLSPYAAVGECRRRTAHACRSSIPCMLPRVTAYKILHRGPRRTWALVRGAAQQGHGVRHLHRGGLQKARPSESASGSSSTAVSSVFASVGVLSNLRARS